MKIQFYGVRGSMPTPGKNTLIYGGNTSCVYVELANGKSLILDAGTGIAALSAKFKNCKQPINLLVTHSHWDHIQGFPYFQPIYCAHAVINIVAGITDNNDNDMILKQMSGANHPVKYHQLPSTITLDSTLAQQKEFTLNGFTITTQAINHPDGGTAYCIVGDNKKLAYITDNELKPPYPEATSWDEWVHFIKDADVLIHDAQYNEHDMPLKHGWGHSTFDQVADLALQANVKQLFFISHDPSKSDNELATQEVALQKRLANKLNLAWAKEGTEFQLDTHSLDVMHSNKAQ